MNKKAAQTFSSTVVSKSEHPGFELGCRSEAKSVGMYIMKSSKDTVFAIEDSNGAISFPTCELNINNCPFKTGPKFIREKYKISICESKWHRVAIVKSGAALIHVMVCDLVRQEINKFPIILYRVDLLRAVTHAKHPMVAMIMPNVYHSNTIVMPTYLQIECSPNEIDGAKGITKKFDVTPEVLEARKVAAIKRSATRQATEGRRRAFAGASE